MLKQVTISLIIAKIIIRLDADRTNPYNLNGKAPIKVGVAELADAHG
jgi:hypothetical protein